MTDASIRLGVAGLGRAFSLLLPTFTQDPRVRLVAATDPYGPACERFAQEFGGRVHADVAALCADPDVEAVYIATPHQMHAEHVCMAARHGKHILVEKPMAITLASCLAMTEAAEAASVALIVGPSHSFDGPVQQARRLIESGAYGRVRMIHAFNYTDFLYRPRRPEELDTAQGGGVIFSQGAHQIDIVRLLGGGLVRSVRAQTGAWDPERPTEGAYSALLSFEGGAFASATYSGYAHYDSDALQDWIGEMGQAKESEAYGAARKRLAKRLRPEEETQLKAEGNYGGSAHKQPVAPQAHAHFGHCLVSCDAADLQLTPRGVIVHGNDRRWLEALPLPSVPRAEVIDELWGALRRGRAPLHDGRWSTATTEACLALLDSAREERDMMLKHQVAPSSLT
jgi:phthalate 4,5-cis-dihydrodiol dehydrogenase